VVGGLQELILGGREAANAFDRDAYVPVRIDESEPPRLFRQAQAQSIAKWVKQKDTDELDQLKFSIMSRIGPLPMYRNLEQVADGSPVQEPLAVTTAARQVGGFTSLSSRSSGLVTSPIALMATRV
jgi:hypothetical protein